MPTVIYDGDYERAKDVLIGPWNMMSNAIATAIAGERERCASVVEKMGRSNGKVRKANKVIAAEIRANRHRIGG